MKKKIALFLCVMVLIGITAGCAKLTVRFDTQGGSSVAIQEVDKGKTIAQPPVPQKTGHAFAGWFTDTTFRSPWDFAKTKVNANTTLYAKWTPISYSISFFIQDGPSIPSQSVSYGAKATEPKVAQKTGHTLSAWHADPTYQSIWDFSARQVVAATTLYARWIPNSYAVTFDTDGGPAIASVDVTYGNPLMRAPVPIRTGYVFEGWFEGPAYTRAWDVVKDPVLQETVLQARWSVERHLLIYHANDNTLAVVPEATSYAYGTALKIQEPKVDARAESPVFNGWSTSADGKGPLYNVGDIITMGDKVITLYAQWFTPVRQVSSKGFHTLVLKQDGTLVGMGYNSNGQLGDGSKTTRKAPVVVMEKVYAISAGIGHSLVLDFSGILWGMGGNVLGQLGDGSTSNRNVPVQIMDSVAAIEAGGYHSLILKKDGTVWATGNNEDGQLGDGSTDMRRSPVKVASEVQSVSAGEYHSLLIKRDGTLWAMGWNDFGQLGAGDTISRSVPVKVMDGVQMVSAGFSHTMVLKQDGTLWAAGNNERGQLGDGSLINRLSPVQVLSDVRSVHAGATHTFVIKKDGSLWAMGGNDYGQLGDGSQDDRPLPVKVLDDVQTASASNQFSHVVTSDGRLWAFGVNEYGQLGDGSTSTRLGRVRIL
jgi:uncharacterized repeat protein (TIGR02543 family)